MSALVNKRLTVERNGKPTPTKTIVACFVAWNVNVTFASKRAGHALLLNSQNNFIIFSQVALISSSAQ